MPANAYFWTKIVNFLATACLEKIYYVILGFIFVGEEGKREFATKKNQPKKSTNISKNPAATHYNFRPTLMFTLICCKFSDMRMESGKKLDKVN